MVEGAPAATCVSTHAGTPARPRALIRGSTRYYGSASHYLRPACRLVAARGLPNSLRCEALALAPP